MTNDTLTQAARDVLAERCRQVDGEGWTPEHDDEHDSGELARAGAAYAFVAGSRSKIDKERVPMFWPWSLGWWKPCNPRRMLVKAAALLLAEIERLDRKAATAKPGWKPCARCTSPGYCINHLRGCDIAESLDSGITPIAFEEPSNDQ